MANFFSFSLLVTSSWSKAWEPNDRRWTCHRQKWPLDPGGHCVMVCVKECASFFRLCSTGHGPLANPVALRWEGADNPNIIQTCGHCFLDTAFWIQSAPALSKNKQDLGSFLHVELWICKSLLFFLASNSFSLCVSLAFYISLLMSSSTKYFYLQMCYVYSS